MTLTRYGRALRRTRGLRIAVALLLLSWIWLPLLVASWLSDHWPKVER